VGREFGGPTSGKASKLAKTVADSVGIEFGTPATEKGRELADARGGPVGKEFGRPSMGKGRYNSAEARSSRWHWEFESPLLVESEPLGISPHLK